MDANAMMGLWRDLNRGTVSERPIPGLENQGLFTNVIDWLHANYGSPSHPVDALSGQAQTIQSPVGEPYAQQAQAPSVSTVDALAGNIALPIPMGWENALPSKYFSPVMTPQAVVPYALEQQGGSVGLEKTAETTAEPTKVSQESRTTQIPEKVYNAPSVSQTSNALPMTFGSGNYAIPNTGYTAGGVYIDPVAYGQDNGGLQHADMGILHQQSPASFGQALAFANLMQGHRRLSGGIGDMTRTMQDIDKANAYQAQGLVANRVQDLMRNGYGADEARYLALTEYGLANGLDRMAVGATMPEYAKAADEQARRRLDTLAAMGGTYQARTGLGYIPLGVESIERNSDGTANAVVNGQRVTDISPEFLMSGVYGAIKGNGAGASNAANAYVDGARTEANARKDIAAIRKDNKDVANGVGKKTKEDEMDLIDHRYARQLELLAQKNALKNSLKSGVTSGVDPAKWKF